MMADKLQSRFPSADSDRIAALADIWEPELDRIIRRMLEISEVSCAAIPLATKHEAIFEMAKLVNSLADKIIEKKLADVGIDDIDLEQERLWLETEECSERIENTAKILAERVWIKFLHEWWKEHPIATSSAPEPARRKFAKVSSRGVRRQHFSPKFSNKYWANGANRARIYSQALNGSVKMEERPVSEWAREDFLYTQSLESLLSAIESDSGVPYKKLLGMVPFSEGDRRHWVAFLIAQLLRTPSFILAHLHKLKQVIARDGIGYATDVASLRKAHETLFTNNQVYDLLYRLICGHEWSILSVSPGDGALIRGDVPAVIDGSVKHQTWRLIYPLTPFKCFVAGPTACDIPNVQIPRSRTLKDHELHALNKLMARRCRNSAMGVTNRDDSDLFKYSFDNDASLYIAIQLSVDDYWGRPC